MGLQAEALILKAVIRLTPTACCTPRCALLGTSTCYCADNADSSVTVSVTMSATAGVNANVTVVDGMPDGVFEASSCRVGAEARVPACG